MYSDLYNRIEDLKSRTANGSISPDELFSLIKDLTSKTEAVDLASGGFNLRKSYLSIIAMNADTTPVDADGRSIRVGQLVSIYNTANDADNDNGKIYRRITGGWEYTGNIVKFSSDRITDAAVTTPKVADAAITKSKLSSNVQSDITNAIKYIRSDANSVSYDITENCNKITGKGVVYSSDANYPSSIFDTYSGLCRGSRLQITLPKSTNATTEFGISFFDVNGGWLFGYKLNYTAAYAVETRTIWLTEAVRSFKACFFTDTATYGMFNAVLLVDDHETLTLDQREICYGQGVNLTLGMDFGGLYTSTVMGCTDYIRCDKASQIVITVPVLTTESSQGIVFYDANFSPIANSGILRPVGAAKGVQTITITRRQIPEGAYCFRACGWNFDNSLLYGAFSCVITYIKGFLGNGRFLPFRPGFIHFSVKVNKAVSNFWDQGATNQEAETFKASTAVMILPDSYTATGKKTKAIMYCHGMSKVVSYTLWGASGADAEGTNALALAQKEAWRTAGYAVFDCNGPYDNNGSPVYAVGSPQAVEAYRKTYEYIIEHYNVDPDIYVIGGSMGGLVALNYCFMFQNVRALALLSPHTAYQCAWNAGVTAEYVSFFGFSSASNFEVEKVRGFDPSLRIQTINSVAQLSYTKHPIKLWIGALESSSLLYTYAIPFMQALRNGNSNAQIRIVAGADHSLVSGGSDVVNAEVITWLSKY